MNKKEISRLLEEIGTILELKGENPFKTRAYFNGARIVEMLDEDLETLVDNGEISKIKGIGQALSEKITTMVKTGSLPFYDDLKSSIPSGLLDMLKIPGLGAKKVKVIFEQLGVTSIGELEYACRENRLRDLAGFGQKSQDKILDGIELQKKYSERFLFPVAENAAEKLLEYLKSNQNLIRLKVAGSLRRKMETVKDIDLIGSCLESKRENAMQHFTDYKEKIRIISKGQTKAAIILSTGITAELRLVKDEEFSFLLQYNTGSKEHNTQLRNLAKANGFKLNEYGLFTGAKSIKCVNEKEIYKNLGLNFIPPELREGLGEIKTAEQGDFADLYSGEPFYGILHVHTTYSDGANTIKQMAQACKSLGLTYLGICDHSKSAIYANGLTEERILKQHKEIDDLNQKDPDLIIFKGIEVDILPDGDLDYSDDVLAEFDFVIASVHSNFKLNEEAQTKRICSALRNRYVTMLGHPTGRLLLAREGYAVNIEEILNVAGEEGKSVEINSNPYRLDIDWQWLRKARKKGIKMSINPDAHSTEGLTDYRYGINIARKGGLTKEDIVNSYTKEQLSKYFQNYKK